MTKPNDELAAKRNAILETETIPPERISQEQLARVLAAKKEKEHLAVVANVALARFKLAEAQQAEIHHEIVTTYGLSATDGYTEDGTIVHNIKTGA